MFIFYYIEEWNIKILKNWYFSKLSFFVYFFVRLGIKLCSNYEILLNILISNGVYNLCYIFYVSIVIICIYYSVNESIMKL